MRLFFGLLIICICFLSSPGHAQTEPVPGDSCAAYPAGSVTRSGGPELGGMVFVMICDANIWKPAAANPVLSAGCAGPGEECDDGTYYAGLTPDGNVPFYAASADGAYKWGQDPARVWPGINMVGLPDCVDTSGTYPAVPDTGGGCDAGQGNTTVLIGAVDAGAPYDAAVYCDSLVMDGHDDWYLPSINELIIVRQNLWVGGNIGQFQSYQRYWSSSELTASSAWSEYFSLNGDPGGDWKNIERPVRCVRKGA